MIIVFFLSSVVIHIYRFSSALLIQINLEKRLTAGVFNSCVRIIPGARIVALAPLDNGGGHIITVIRNMGVDMMPVLIIMGNHFPAVIAATIVETGVPLTV